MPKTHVHLAERAPTPKQDAQQHARHQTLSAGRPEERQGRIRRGMLETWDVPEAFGRKAAAVGNTGTAHLDNTKSDEHKQNIATMPL